MDWRSKSSSGSRDHWRRLNRRRLAYSSAGLQQIHDAPNGDICLGPGRRVFGKLYQVAIDEKGLDPLELLRPGHLRYVPQALHNLTGCLLESLNGVARFEDCFYDLGQSHIDRLDESFLEQALCQEVAQLGFGQV